MPIVDIHWVGALPPAADELASRLADVIGDALGLGPGRVWVRLDPVAHYAENGGALEGEPPVFVRVLHAHPPTGETLKTEIAALTTAVAQAAGRPEHRVHLEYAAAGSGRMAFGGRLVD
jgi:phenylpyruvate tautomerase PptA (4-oxalocrotonate tautomerase family)